MGILSLLRESHCKSPDSFHYRLLITSSLWVRPDLLPSPFSFLWLISTVRSYIYVYILYSGPLGGLLIQGVFLSGNWFRLSLRDYSLPVGLKWPPRQGGRSRPLTSQSLSSIIGSHTSLWFTFSGPPVWIESPQSPILMVLSTISSPNRFRIPLKTSTNYLVSQGSRF